jgi:hypothetical protein
MLEIFILHLLFFPAMWIAATHVAKKLIFGEIVHNVCTVYYLDRQQNIYLTTDINRYSNDNDHKYG